VFLLFASLYLLSIGRGFYSSDGDVMYQTTAALIERHTFALAPDPGLPQIVAGQDHRFYSKYDPGLALIGVPFYATGDWIARTNHAHRYRVTTLFYLLIPALAAAGTLAAFDLSSENKKQFTTESTEKNKGREKKTRFRAAPPLHRVERGPGGEVRLAILAAGLATPLWVYARTLYAETVLACALTWAVGGVWRAGQAQPLRKQCTILALAGAAFGIGVLTRAALAIYLPALIYILIRGAPDRRCRSVAIRLMCFGAGIAPAAALLLAHNALRFGAPLHFGYAGEGFTTPPWKGIAGLLFSPGKSVFLYAPPLVLCVLLWPRYRRIAPARADFLALAWATALLFYGSWWAWDGGWCWGPRFLVPLIPLSCLPLTALPDRRAWRLAAGVAILAGIGVQIGGVITDIIPHYAQVAAGRAADVDRMNFSLSESPLMAAIRDILHGQTEPLGLFHLRDTGLPVTWTVGVPVLLILGVIAGFWGMMKRKVTGRRASAPTNTV
jgi:hypothetical protein